jgi:hypothetical protein
MIRVFLQSCMENWTHNQPNKVYGWIFQNLWENLKAEYRHVNNLSSELPKAFLRSEAQSLRQFLVSTCHQLFFWALKYFILINLKRYKKIIFIVQHFLSLEILLRTYLLAPCCTSLIIYWNIFVTIRSIIV